MHYASFDKAVSIAVSAGRGAWLAKSDIKSAFRLLPVSPEDYELLGFSFDGSFYYDRCLPMGCSISCALFEKFSTLLEFRVKFVTKSSSVTHYLDDFLFVGSSRSSCSTLLNTFTTICEELGVPLAHEKTEGPSQTITFLGLEIDTLRQEIRVPEGKVQKICAQNQQTLSQAKISLLGIQSLVGSLNFLCRAIAPGRAFLRRLIALSIGLNHPYHKVRITKGARLDLLMWLQFLSHFNGVSAFLKHEWVASDALELFTDAAASIGFGAYFGGRWTQGRWQDELISNPPSIAFLEFFPVVVAVKCWGALLANHKVLFHCDNTAVVCIINKRTSGCPRIMHLLRIFVLECLKYNIVFKAVHVPGTHNERADALSRFQMQRFRSASPHADQKMTPLPILPQVW